MPTGPCWGVFAQAALDRATEPRRSIGGRRIPVGILDDDGGHGVAGGFAAREQRRPVSNSNSTTPKAQISARSSTGLPRACSGDMYAAVPRIMPACVIDSDSVCQWTWMRLKLRQSYSVPRRPFAGSTV
jgi:hypothetical protein